MYKYKAFISHSHQDKRWAEKLQRKLESFALGRRGNKRFPLRPVFLDRSELAVAPDLSDALNEALVASEALIVVCSPSAAKSEWVNREVLAFKRLGKTRIFAIIVDNAPASNHCVTDFMPPALWHAVDDDGQLTSDLIEPLAADARRGQDGSDALMKLISGLIEVPFDSLKLRQHRRDKHKAFAISGVSASVAFLTAYLALTAFFARNDAELHRDKAEELISYMLSDLREELQPVGRLDILDGVGEQVLDYFAGLDNSQLGNEVLINRAKALRQIGEVRVSQGHFDEGLVAFTQAEQILSGKQSSNQPDRLFELGQIHYWIADAYFRNSNLSTAKEHITSYLNISRQLVELDAENETYRRELLYAESNLGTLAFRENDIAQAKRYFTRSLEIGRSLATSDTRFDAIFELADTISWLAAIDAAEGNLSSASQRYQEQIALRQQLITLRGAAEDKHLMARALYLSADIHRQQADHASELQALNRSVQIYRELIAYDPENETWRREGAWAQSMLVRSSYSANLMTATDAKQMLVEAREDLLSTGDEMNVDRQRVLARLHIEQARVEFAEGSPDLALGICGRVIEQLQPLLEDADRIRLLPLYSEAVYIAAEAERFIGNDEQARSLARQALDIISIQASDPVETRVYSAFLFYVAGRQEAVQLVEGISNTGYLAEPYLAGTDSAEWWQQNVYYQTL